MKQAARRPARELQTSRVSKKVATAVKPLCGMVVEGVVEECRVCGGYNVWSGRV